MKLPKFTAEDLAWWITCAVILLGIAFSGCSAKLTPYSDDLRRQYKWDESDLPKITLYTSGPITLTADTTSRKVEIRKGIIYDNTGQKVEQILIPAYTGGAFLFSHKAERMAIGFSDDDQEFLIFGPNPKKRNYYTLFADEWQKNVGKVTFLDQKWLVSTEQGLVYLQVDLRKIKKTKVNTKVLEGRKPSGP